MKHFVGLIVLTSVLAIAGCGGEDVTKKPGFNPNTGSDPGSVVGGMGDPSKAGATNAPPGGPVAPGAPPTGSAPPAGGS